MSILAVLDTFQRKPVRMAIVVDEYGSLEGIVTQTDLMEAIAGNIPEVGEEPSIVEREDGSLLMDGMMSAEAAFDRLAVTAKPDTSDFATSAGFMIFQLGRIPAAGDAFMAFGWRFEMVNMDGRRIDKVLAKRVGL